jgi:hypothetical protein
MGKRMITARFKRMKIRGCVFELVAIDMVNNLPRLSIYNQAVLTFPVGSSIPQTSGGPVRQRRFTGSFSLCVGNRFYKLLFGKFRYHPVPSTNMDTRWLVEFLFLICVQGIAVTSQHLVVSLTQVTSHNRAVAVQAGTPNSSTTPAVFGRAVFLDALVMHQAITMRCMLPSTAFDRTNWTHHLSLSYALIITYVNAVGKWLYKQIGNSVAVPCVEWITRRLSARAGVGRDGAQTSMEDTHAV